MQHKKLPNAITHKIISSLESKDAEALYGVDRFFNQHKAFYKKFKDKLPADPWIEKIVAAGVDAKVMKQIADTKVIHQYKLLYQIILKFLPITKGCLQAWELYCLSGEIPAIKQAQQEKLNASTRGIFDNSALHHAARSGSKEAVKYLIKEFKINPNIETKYGETMLLSAAASDSIELIKYLVDNLKMDVTKKSSSGFNATHAAMRYGALKVLDYLLSLKSWMFFPIFDLMATDNIGLNLLHIAAISKSLEGMKLAISRGIPATSKVKKDGSTALHCAARGGSIAAIRYALNELKLPKESTDNNGNNILILSPHSNSIATVEYLINEIKIDPYSVNKHGTTMLHSAVNFDAYNVVLFIRHHFPLLMGMQNNNGLNVFWFADQIKDATAKAKMIALLNTPDDQLPPLEPLSASPAENKDDDEYQSRFQKN